MGVGFSFLLLLITAHGAISHENILPNSLDVVIFIVVILAKSVLMLQTSEENVSAG